jgi:lipopolysaccharide biosynthesis glycosyltransferase
MILFSCTNRAYQDVSLVWAHSFKNSCEKFENNKKFTPILFCTTDVDTELFADTGIEIRYLPTIGGVEEGLFNQTTTEGMVMRLKAMDLLHAEGVEKVAYMDTDTLIRGDISELLLAPLTPEKPIAAASDFVYIDDDRLGSTYQQIVPDYPRRTSINKKYFNSGVMVLLLRPLVEETKRYGCTSLESFYLKHKEMCRFPDQDALNKLAREYVGLPRRYNFFPELHIFAIMSSDELMHHRARIFREGVIVHFLSLFKPWVKHDYVNTATMQVPFEMYWEALKPIRHKLSPSFVENVRYNVETHRIIIEQARHGHYNAED